MRLVAQQSSSMGHQRQERLEQIIAGMTPRSASPDRDHMQHLQKQLAYKDAQFEHARSQRDIRFVQEEELVARARPLSSETRTWKSHIVNEAEHVLVMECAGASQRTSEIKETTD